MPVHTHHQTVTTDSKQEIFSPFTKGILIVDDDSDITYTFKKGFETENKNNRTFFKVDTCNNSSEALSQFEPNLYDTLLVEIICQK